MKVEVNQIEHKNNSEISFGSQRCVYLANALRLKERCVFGIVDGKKVNVDAQCICNRAEITDNYDIINPATVKQVKTAVFSMVLTFFCSAKHLYLIKEHFLMNCFVVIYGKKTVKTGN